MRTLGPAVLAGAGPVRLAAAVLVVMIGILHAPVFTRGALIAPAGGLHGQWPWRAYGNQPGAGDAPIGHDETPGDLLFQVHPWQLFTARSLQGGWIPLWNPHSYCGVPFVANAQSAVFYPLHWPAWVLPTLRVFTVAMLMKVLLAGLFMAVFLRGLGCGALPCLVGSVSFAMCGFMTGWLGYPHTNAAVVLPLLMHGARLAATAPSTGAFLVLAFAGAAQYLGGHPWTSLHIIGASCLYFLWNLVSSRRPRLAVALFAGASALGFLMAAVQMLPFLSYLMRSAALGQRQVLAGGEPTPPIDAFMTLLVPGYHGGALDVSYHGQAAWLARASYTGCGVLLLALVSSLWLRRARFFIALAMVCAAVAYGPQVPDFLPLTLLISFSLATLAALALEGLSSAGGRGDEGPSTMTRLATTGAAALLLAGLALGSVGREPIGARLAAAMVGGTALLAVLAILRPSRGHMYRAGVAVITCLDMLLFARGLNPHCDPATIFPPTRLTDYLRRDAAADMVRGGRLMTVGRTMRPDIHMPYWLSSIEGHDPMVPAEYGRLLDRAQVARVHETGYIPPDAKPLLDLMGARYVVTPPGGVVSGDAMALEYDGPDGRVFVNRAARPRFSVVPRAAPSRVDPLDALEKGLIDLDREVLLDPAAAPATPEPMEAPGSAPAPPSIRLDRNTPGDLSLVVRGDGPGYLVVTDAYDPGWKALVDGGPVEVLRANYLFMAVRVPAGESSVTFTYRPISFRVGVWASVISLLVCITVGLVRLGSTLGGGPAAAT